MDPEVGRPSSSPWRGSTPLRVASGYALLATLAIGLTMVLRDGMPWAHPDPWVELRPAAAVVLSAGLGLAFAVIVVLATRVVVVRFDWARRLHAELRPVARDLGLGQILVLAALSSLGEELLFRGLLVPWLGVAIPGVLFGLAHQIRGPSRWVWVAWASFVGVALGALFALTGSLVGPLVAHAAINALNLTFLRDYDPALSSERAG